MSEWVVEGNYRVKRLKSGAVIKSEIPPEHGHPPQDSAEMALLKKIADSLGVTY